MKRLTIAGILIIIVVILAAVFMVAVPGKGPGPHARLLTGITLDLRTAHTAHGPVQYDLAGASGPVVLSVHGGLGGADQGRLLADWLLADGFQVLSPSRPGYLGTPLDSGRTLDQEADLLAALLDELGIARVAVFAVSSGAPVAYTFVARYPERVWALVTIDGVSRADPGAGKSSAVRRVFVDTVGQRLAQLTAAVSLPAVLSSTLDETSTFTAAQKKQRIDYITHDVYVRSLFAAFFRATFPYRERMPGTRNDEAQTRDMDLPLERITAPTLIVHGTQDGDVPFADGADAAARISGSQHYWMPSEDHLGFWLSPERARAQNAVRSFLQEHQRL